MDINNMREFVSNAYPGRTWKARVNMMSSNQVVAIYHSLNGRKKNIQTPINKDSVGYQLTIYDLLRRANERC